LKINRLTIILIVAILIIGSLTTILMVEGNKRADPGEVTWESKLFEDYGINRHGVFFISDDVIYGGAAERDFGSPIDGQVIAVDLETDELLWNHSHHVPTGHSLVITSVYESDGVVYTGSYDGILVAADASTGERIWNISRHRGRGWHGAIRSIDVFEDMVFTASSDESVAVTDAETGELLWNHTHHDGGVFSVQYSDGVVYSTCFEGDIIAADRDTGELLWRRSHDQGWYPSLYVEDGVMYTGCTAGESIALDLEDKEIIWSRTHHGDRILGLHVDDGIIYSGAFDGYVIASDSSNGEEIWRHRYQKERDGRTYRGEILSVQAYEGNVYSSDSAGTVIAVEQEGNLLLGISRTLSGFWEAHSGTLFITLIIALVAIALIFGKTRSWSEPRGLLK